MSRLRTTALLAAAALSLTACGDAVSSMTEHWFYGYVVSVDAAELCLDDARTEDLQAQRCFDATEAGGVEELAEGDLVKVRYEREDGGHGGGRAVEARMVRAAGRSDG
ncbi:MAG TPA: hypothetical protein VNU01_13095 [Egibacteraceae bacterium]|nr:hypothetical protein [Egibacteraceae bacterium]